MTETRGTASTTRPTRTYDESDDAGDDEDYPPEGGRRKRRGRSIPGCLAALVALALIAGGAYVAVTKGAEFIRDQFSTAADYPGPGRGKVTFEVESGDTVGQIGRNLKAKGVVQSVDAFIEASNGESGIQVGYYQLKKEMRAADAFEILSNPANIIKTTVTIPEGIAGLGDRGDRWLQARTSRRRPSRRCWRTPRRSGCPTTPAATPRATCSPRPTTSAPTTSPSTCSPRWSTAGSQAADDAGLEEAAEAMGYTPHEMMTIASMIEAEGRGDYRAKIARVIYNRLEIDPNPSAGFLQIDATVNYALGRPGPAVLTTEEIDSVADSPYNTYRQKGLPPGPIEAPGEDSIEAALNPEDGPWFFYVTTNLETGETKFTDSYDEFLAFKGELQEYCETQSDRC